MSRIDELRAKRNNLHNRSEEIFEDAERIRQESLRVADVAHNAEIIIKNLDEEFAKKTGIINKTDLSFLMIVTEL